MDEKLEQLCVNTIRFLAVDAVQKANSGHPGMPMGTADLAFVLWYYFLRFHPEDPAWPDRDRFVLSAGHGSMLLYALLHLFGYDLPMKELQRFRQLGSKTPGHPEYRHTPGVETTTGPLGQGFGNGVGMAIAGKMLAGRVNTDDAFPVSYRVFGIVSDGDLMEGVASEAASIAGHLGLNNLIYIYDDNHITIEGNTALAFSEDVGARFEAYGWFVQRVDGHDRRQVYAALQKAIAEPERPSLIIARTHIAYGSPGKQDSAEAHGAPLGEEEVLATKRNLGWPERPAFFVPEEVRMALAQRVKELGNAYRAWQKKFQEWRTQHPPRAEEWDRLFSRPLPADFPEVLRLSVLGQEGATRALSGKVLQKAAELVPALCGGSADLGPSTKTAIRGSTSVQRGDFSGRNFHFGIREHGMGAILNGLALAGPWVPYGSTFLVFSDYMRPPMRLAAMMGIQVIYVFTHDSIFLGEDGPTHQPVEHLAALRVIPNLLVIRPADAEETAFAWALALERKDGPTALVFTRQSVPALERQHPLKYEAFRRGAYVVLETGENPEFVLVASGSEVHLACRVAEALKQRGKSVRVVSVPADKLLALQPAEVRQELLGEDGRVRRVLIEAAVPDTWARLLGSGTLFIGQTRFGASAPAKALAEHFGFTVETILRKMEEQGWV